MKLGQSAQISSWDGRNDSSSYANDGYYTAEAIYNFNNGHMISSAISNIAMDANPPVYKLAVSPDLFTPDSSGENNLLRINLQLNDFSGVSGWQINIYKKNDSSEKGTLFKSFYGSSVTNTIIQWDGYGNDTNDFVESARIISWN